MMLLMTESFSKLSTAFSEGKHETKSEWPKFNGDAKRFRSWYLGIMTQISLPPWQEFYDSVTHDIVSTMSNSSILALEGSAYKNFVSRKHLRANGLLLLEKLVQTYKPRNVPGIIAAKTVHQSNRCTPVSSDQNAEPENHQKKVREWFLNPNKFCREIEACQLCYPGKCIYHLVKSQPTEKCGVKKECEEIIAGHKTNKSSQSTSSSTGQLRHITEEDFVDAAADEDVCENEIDSNDTNEDSLLYFSRLSKHYLRLVKNYNPNAHSRHPVDHPVIADSGANYHMFREREFFHVLTPARGSVILGDGKTTVKIEGVGTVRCKIGPNMLDIPNVRFVPGLSESIYSLHQHIKTPNHGLE